MSEPGVGRGGFRRLRRWLLRGGLWSLALVALLIFGGALALDTQPVRELVRRHLETRLSETLDATVVIQRVDFALLPLELEVWGLEVRAAPGLGTAPFARVPYLLVDAELFALRRRVLRMHRVRIERPELDVTLFDDVDNLPRPRAGAAEDFELWIERLEVIDARWVLDDRRIDLSVAGDELRARFHDTGGRQLAGEVAVRNVVLRLPSAQPVELDFSTAVALDADGLSFADTRVTRPGAFAFDGSGGCVWQDGGKCELALRGEVRGDVLRQLDYSDRIRGAFGIEGTLAWRPGSAGWRGRVWSEDVELFGIALSGLDGRLTADAYEARLEVERARWAGGTVEGVVDCDLSDPSLPIRLDLAVAGLDVDPVAAVLDIPVRGIASTLDGSVRYVFPYDDRRHGDGRGDLRLRPLGVASPGTVAFEGEVGFAITNGVLRTEALRLASPTQGVLVEDGRWDLAARTGRFEWEIATTDLARLLPLVPDLDDPDALWRPTAGSGRLEGVLTLGDEERGLSESGARIDSVEARVELDDVVTAGGHAPRLDGTLRWSDGTGRGWLEELRLVLADNLGHQVRIEGRLPTDFASDPSGARLHLAVTGWPVADARPWVDVPLPLDGRLSGRLDLDFTTDGSHGRLTAVVDETVIDLGTAGPLAADRLRTRLDWQGDVLHVREASLILPAGELGLTGSVDFAAETLDLEWSGSRLDLAAPPFDRLRPSSRLTGRFAADGRLTGAFLRPRFTTTVTATELALDERRLDPAGTRLELDWDGRLLAARGRLFEHLTLAGGGRADTEAVVLDFEVEVDEVAALVPVLVEEPRVPVDGRLAGDARVEGTWPSLVSTLTLRDLVLDVGQRRVEASAPVRLRLDAGRLHVDEAALRADDGSVARLGGSLELTTDPALALEADGVLAARSLEPLLAGSVMRGDVAATLRVEGRRSAPVVTGRARLALDELGFEGWPHPLTGVVGELVAQPTGELVVDRLEADVAGGRLEVSGRLPLPWHETVGDEPFATARSDGQLRFELDDVTIRALDGWLLAGDADLSVRPFDDGFLVGGEVLLDRARYVDDLPTFSQLVQGFFRRHRLEVAEVDERLAALTLDIDVRVTDGVEIDNNVATATGSAELVLRGDPVRPLLFGEVELDAGGLLRYGGVEYTLDRGRLLFSEPTRIDPELDVVASTRVREYDVTLALTGTASRLDASFRSEPPLPDVAVFQLLATGGTSDVDPRLPITTRRREVLAEDELGRSTSAASWLYGEAATAVGQRWRDLFGLDTFRVDPLTTSGDAVSTARVTVGKQLSRTLSVTYSADPSSTEEQRLQVEWRLDRGLVLVLTQNGDGSYAADARWEQSFP